MNGAGHMVLGGALWTAGAIGLAVAGVAVPAAQVATGAVLCTGMSILPDIDHPTATIAQTFGPVSRWGCRIVSAVSGGHRGATHKAAFGVLAGLAAWAVSMVTIIAVGVLVALCVAWMLRRLAPRRIARRRLAGGAVALLAGVVAASVTPAGPWVGVAVGGGCFAHLIGDHPVLRAVTIGALGVGAVAGGLTVVGIG